MSFKRRPSLHVRTLYSVELKSQTFQADEITDRGNKCFSGDMSREHKGKLTLDALLIMLLQRIPRYELLIKHSFAVSSDNTHTVNCMATSGLGVWITTHHSAILRLFHATTYECLYDLNVAPSVTKMLAGCDGIIRQHKAACLRVTALLACKDLL